MYSATNFVRDGSGRPVAGVDYPRTFQEMDEWFRSDAGCRDYIHRSRWPDGFACPHCGWTGEPWVTSRGLLPVSPMSAAPTGPGSRNKGHRRTEEGCGIERIAFEGRVLGLPSSLRPECRVARTVVHTDGWSGYRGLATAGYQHQVTIISDGSEPAHEVMPRVHTVALLKRWLLGTHQGAFSTGISTTTSTNSPSAIDALGPGPALPQGCPTGCRCRTDPLPHLELPIPIRLRN